MIYYYLGIAYSHKKEVNLAVDAYKRLFNESMSNISQMHIIICQSFI